MYAPMPLHPPSEGYVAMVISWTPTTGLIPCHIQPGPITGLVALLNWQKPREGGMLMANVDGKAIG